MTVRSYWRARNLAEAAAMVSAFVALAEAHLRLSDEGGTYWDHEHFNKAHEALDEAQRVADLIAGAECDPAIISA